MTLEVILYTANGALAIALGIMSYRQHVMNRNLHILKHLVEGMGLYLMAQANKKENADERVNV
jgi:hypothetical protein